ncbi:hypothetical protein V1264_015220 [Littorina saxatilis]|uniref:Uncharacterized protein n=1 Tax=Littorina saxatilis TaxID=31220 RepID=A0AAN9GHT9_9CAEN
MKVLIVVALLVAAASAQFFCPDSEAGFQCMELHEHTAFCMSDSNWVCGKCEVKRLSCFGGLEKAKYDSTCSASTKPSC